jgi:hypothetical protein
MYERRTEHFWLAIPGIKRQIVLARWNTRLNNSSGSGEERGKSREIIRIEEYPGSFPPFSILIPPKRFFNKF